MIRRLASERDLTVLRLASAGDPGHEVLRCVLVMGDEGIDSHEVPLARLGLAPTLDRRERLSDSRRRDPARLASFPNDDLEKLAAVLQPVVGPGEPLWLEIARSAGLTAIPWERWFQPLTGGPVLRLPYLPVHPAYDSDRVEMVVCASAPVAKSPFPVPDLLATTVGRIVETGVPARFHVFSEASAYPEVESALEAHVHSGAAIVYPPSGASSYGSARRVRGIVETAKSSALESPWLRWMLGELPNVSIDLALFVCHGYYSDGLGALAFAESPLDDQDRYWARFVGSRQLITFLDHLGAVGLVTVSPESNFSLSGSLALVDEIARDRPGPAMAVNLRDESDGTTLGRALAFLFGVDGHFPPAARGLTLYCHPDLLLSDLLVRDRAELDVSLESHTLARPSSRGLRKGPARHGLSLRSESKIEGPSGVPRWASASQRIMERRAADLSGLEMSVSTVGQATRLGRDEALRFVADLLRTSLDEGKGGGGGS